jgi:hypothetical protein
VDLLKCADNWKNSKPCKKVNLEWLKLQKNNGLTSKSFLEHIGGNQLNQLGKIEHMMETLNAENSKIQQEMLEQMNQKSQHPYQSLARSLASTELMKKEDTRNSILPDTSMSQSEERMKTKSPYFQSDEQEVYFSPVNKYNSPSPLIIIDQP